MQTRSLLINYNSLPSSLDSLMPDNGLINIASSLISAGHQTEILDFSTLSFVKELIPENTHKELASAYFELTQGRGNMLKALPRFQHLNIQLERRKEEVIRDSVIKRIITKIEGINPHFVGFKLWTGEGFIGSVELAKTIKKKYPLIKIIAGGPHNDWFHEHTFEYTDVFDVLVYGEGEEIILDIAKWALGKKKLESINNVIYKENNKINKTSLRWVSNLDSLAEPIFDSSIYPALEGNEKIKVIMIDESRGCPNSCNFCIHPKKSGNKWRSRNAKKVVKIMNQATEKLGTSCFRLAGSNPPPSTISAIADKIINDQLNIDFISFGHTRNNPEDFPKLKKAGCKSLFFGIESGNRDILRNVINKKVVPNTMKRVLLACKNSGIPPVVSVIAPCPSETMGSFNDTLRFLLETRPAGISVYLPGVIPGAEWFENRQKYNIELTESSYTALMTYTIKFLMPPMLWQPMPYTIGKYKFQQMMLAADLLSSNLERNGLLTGLNETMLLFADKLKMTPSQIRDLNRKIFITGDSNVLEDTITNFNKSMGDG